ncbi:MAG: hypothetical protein LBP33_07045 [Candidatus Adiutrix sp.]|jgi:uncharacterized protein YgbK (DUF1537 family)|nr:hypothetical protein [Candidatus Adiutrix sp.]
MLELIIIADDLTGAADTGVRFLGGGPVKLAALGRPGRPAGDWGLAVDTASRNAPAEKIPDLMQQAADLVRAGRPRIVYKKIDSCLRGQIGPELERLLLELGRAGALVVPAYPALGRVTRHGLHYVGDCLVSESESARDPLRPVRDSRLAAVVGQDCGLAVRSLDLGLIRRGPDAVLLEIRAARGPGPTLWAADAESEVDLDILALAGLAESDRLILSGSAGLAGALARRLRPGGAFRPAGARTPAPPALFLAGSASAVLKEQIDCLAERAGARVFTLNLETLMKSGPAALPEPWPKAAGPEGPLVVKLPPGQAGLYGSRQIIEAFGRLAARLVTERRPRSLFISGGDTARSTLNALGIEEAWLRAEIEPGVALLEAGALDILTKSGGFGDRELLSRLYQGKGL